MIGTRLAHYEVTGHLGSGGMGEVYQADDLKLGRSVAIKFLPEVFTHDTERVARFAHEARVLASLNHSNIAAIHGLEEIDGRHFLVMELVPGETLARRIQRGAIPVEEALSIAIQITEALEAAHNKGIVHRDLKPANIKLTKDGTAKVLDFGLAKAGEAEAAANFSDSPTLLSGSTPGMIMGTAAYMSPEQARGREVDRRTDIFAFGTVLYEMLTGRAAFEGEGVQEILSAVIRAEPDWTLLPANVHPRIRELVRLCLEKDVRKRRSDAADVRIDIEQAMTQPPAIAAVPAPSTTRERLWTSVAAVCLIASAALSVPTLRHFREAAPPEIRFEVNTPPTVDRVSFAISPDGRRLVFVASNDGKAQLWTRPLDSLAAQPLAGTEGASYPFWSPDSASVGFFAYGKLKRIDIVGGAPQELAGAADGHGGSWNRQGIIVFAPTGGGPLSKVRASGGETVTVTRLQSGQGTHRFPQFLPDGQHFIYFVEGPQAVYVGALDSDASRRLVDADAAAVVSPSGFLLFPRQTTLFAQSFDFKKLELSGNPIPVAEQVALDPAHYASAFSTSSDILAYRTSAAAVTRQLTWLDRSGKTASAVGAPDAASLSDVELSPNGKSVAVHRTINGNSDVWLIDAIRGVATRFTFDALNDVFPVWSPDGERVVFTSNRSGVYTLYAKASSGAGREELLLEPDQNKAPQDWSSDGHFLLYRSLDPKTGSDLWVLPISGDRKPFSFLKTPFEDREGQFSPDAKWIAYQSNESGPFEIYVQPFPGPGAKFQISTNGGAQPRWNKNGKEIFYVSLDSKMMTVPVKLSPDGQSLETGTPAVLFSVRIAGGPLPGVFKQQYAVSGDGQRFLVNLEAGDGTTSPIIVIYDWKPPSK